MLVKGAPGAQMSGPPMSQIWKHVVNIYKNLFHIIILNDFVKKVYIAYILRTNYR